MSQKLVLIDGHSILNRAFYGVPDLSNAEGLHTNAVYGFLNIMFKILEEEKPEQEKLNRMLAENTGKDYETICADTERDNWKSAEEACEYGLIDKVITFHEA